MTIKAIETQYAGCRFRSRLEARWAVFFDKVDIEWQYEPQGFETPAGRYLPDFYLPQGGAWIEVKGGSFTARDRMRAEYVADRMWAERGDKFRVLQGDVPRPGTRTPLRMKGTEDLPGVLCLSRHVAYSEVEARANKTGNPRVAWECVREAPRDWGRMPWLGGWTAEQLDAALQAARSARFELGARG